MEKLRLLMRNAWAFLPEGLQCLKTTNLVCDFFVIKYNKSLKRIFTNNMPDKKKSKNKKNQKEMSAAKMMFWMLVEIFALTLFVVVVPAFREYIDPFFVIVFGATFSFLGAGLIFLTEKEKIKGKLRKFLILTGMSAVGLVAGSILHNLFYGLGEMAGDIIALNFLAQTFHIMFFIIAVLICPFAFLVSTAGSIVLFSKEKKERKERELVIKETTSHS